MDTSFSLFLEAHLSNSKDGVNASATNHLLQLRGRVAQLAACCACIGLRQLPLRPQREAVRLLIPRGWGGVMYAAQVAANAASAAMPYDEKLFPLLSKCTKYRI